MTKKIAVYIILILLFSNSVFCQSKTHIYFAEWLQNSNDSIFLALKNESNQTLEKKCFIFDSIAQGGFHEKDYKKYLFYKTELASLLKKTNKPKTALDTLEATRKLFASIADTMEIEYINSLKEQILVLEFLDEPTLAPILRLHEIAIATKHKYDSSIDSPYIFSISKFVEYYSRKKDLTYMEYVKLMRDEYKKLDYFVGIALADQLSYRLLNSSYDLREAMQIAQVLNNNKLEPLLSERKAKLAYVQNTYHLANLYKDTNYPEAIFYYSKLLNIDFALAINYHVYAHAQILRCYSLMNDTLKANEQLIKFLNLISNKNIAKTNKATFYYIAAEAMLHINPELSYGLIDSSIVHGNGTYFKQQAINCKFSIYFKQGKYEKAIDYAHKMLNLDSVKNTLQIADLNFEPKGKLIWASMLARSYFLLWDQNHKQSDFNSFEKYALVFMSIYKDALATNIGSFESDNDIQIFFNSFLDGYLLKAYLQYDLFKQIDDDFIMEAILLSKSQTINNTVSRLDNTSAIENMPIVYDYVNNLNAIQKQKIYLSSIPDSLVTKDDLIYYSDLFFENALFRIEIDKLDKSNIKPNYNNLSFITIQENLSEDQAIIDYFVTDSNIYASLITKDNFYFNRNASNTIKKESKKLLRSIKTGENISNHKLSTLLLSDFQDELKNKTELIIIPDKWLNTIPFEVLNLTNNKKLIDNFSISYNYSAQSWYNSNKNTSNKSEKSLFALAPVFSDDNTNKIDSINNDLLANTYRGSMELSPLPSSLKEVKKIQNLFKKEKLVNFSVLHNNANEQNVYANYNKYSIVHFATHGITNKDHFDRSGLYLFQDNDTVNKSSKSDNFLSLGEIYALESQPNLVVLSACKTGTGKIVEGEGVMALPRGFIYAGVPNVIASLWKVHDERTKDLMVAFYKHLLEDKVSYAEALRRAKLDCIKKGFLPVDWAGFVLIGS